MTTIDPARIYQGIPNARKKRLWQATFERDDWTCQHCGEADRDKLTVDHVIPKARGGTDHPANLQTLCEPCNQAKGGA